MHSFYSFDYVTKLSLNKITRLLVKAFEKKQENKVWQLYVSKFPHFTQETFQTFDEFYDPNNKENDMSEQEILKDVKEIIDTFMKEGEENRTV